MRCPCCASEVNLDPVQLAYSAQLSGAQLRVFEQLGAKFGQWVRITQLAGVIWDQPDGGPENYSNALNQVCYRLNAKIKAYGLWIEHAYGSSQSGAGYRRLVKITESP